MKHKIFSRFKRGEASLSIPQLRTHLVIGHSGHRNVFEDQQKKIQESISFKLKQIRDNSQRPCLLLTGLAEGADKLAVRAALELGIEVAILLGKDEQENKKELENLYGTSMNAYQVKGEKDQLFANQADLIIRHSRHILLAWDGIQNNLLGGPSYIFKQVHYHNKADKQTCLHQLMTPRESSPFASRAAGMGRNKVIVGNAELSWVESAEPFKKPLNIQEWFSAKFSWNLVAKLNKYESLFLQAILPAFLLLLTIIAGYNGFKDYQACVIGKDDKKALLDAMDYFFKAVNLSSMGTSVLGEYVECSNRALNLARISGAMLFTYAFMLAFLKLTGSNLNRFWILVWRVKFASYKLRHILFSMEMKKKGAFDTIIGLSEQSHYLALDLIKNHRKVIIIDEEGSAVHKTTCQQAGAIIFGSKPTLDRVFEKAKVKDSDSIYVFSDEDTKNARNLQHVDRYLLRKGKKRKPRLFVHVSGVSERHFLQNTTSITMETFQVNENISRKLLREYPIDRDADTHYKRTGSTAKDIKAIILGFSPLAEKMCLHIAGNSHFHKSLPLSITIYHEEEEFERVRDFKARFTCFYENGAGYDTNTFARAIQREVFLPDGKSLINFEVLPKGEYSVLHDGFSLYSQLKKGSIVTIYNCMENAVKGASFTHNILPMLNYLKKQNQFSLEVFCFCNLPDLQEIDMIEEKLNTQADSIAVYCFGNYIKACSYQAIHQNHLDRFTRRHALWFHHTSEDKISMDDTKKMWIMRGMASIDIEAAAYWANMQENLKDANRAAADHIFVKLRRAGVKPTDGLLTISEKLYEIENQLAEMEHSRWCAQKIIEGFAPLCDLDNYHQAKVEWLSEEALKKMYQSLRLHLNLVPYKSLEKDESIKDNQLITGIPFILNLQSRERIK
ncbi:hypothetical protein [Pedobacter sp.]|uniref:hypothetical protein n=1 Tax=Pedobacter sp. TaxID=1411316 RepID=UPI003BAB6282